MQKLCREGGGGGDGHVTAGGGVSMKYHAPTAGVVGGGWGWMCCYTKTWHALIFLPWVAMDVVLSAMPECLVPHGPWRRQPLFQSLVLRQPLSQSPVLMQSLSQSPILTFPVQLPRQSLVSVAEEGALLNRLYLTTLYGGPFLDKDMVSGAPESVHGILFLRESIVDLLFYKEGCLRGSHELYGPCLDEESPLFEVGMYAFCLSRGS
ncbi:hypothetical protein DUNSADRAFT_1609 [Dunaliella salina]|uniref:Uncharacterized protein n=1 Tax=Dunaliella salina TaxID=3046 RepID=A0ABQ7H8J6_DUNSA|nr:hypothetical protein DUNSADRAFT_1609 [Dunaliella salina]|eukprot:KAF5843182.1 hypothetical protein DUNSADRAFT_1609 [Dunaliella salina]